MPVLWGRAHQSKELEESSISYRQPTFHDAVNALSEDAEQLEQVYQEALKAGEAAAFKEAIDASHTARRLNRSKARPCTPIPFSSDPKSS